MLTYLECRIDINIIVHSSATMVWLSGKINQEELGFKLLHSSHGVIYLHVP